MRKNRRKKTAKRWWIWMLGSLVLVAFAIMTGGYLWLKNFMQSDKLRYLVEESLGHETHAEIKLPPLRWSGSDCYADALSATGYREAGFVKAEATSLRASLDMKMMRSGVWSLPLLAAESLRLEFNPSVSPPPDSRPSPVPYTGLFSRLLPTRTEWKLFRIRDAGFTLKAPDGALSLTGVNLEGRRIEAGGIQLAGSQGSFSVPGVDGTAELRQISASLSTENLQVTDSEWNWKDANLYARGDLSLRDGSGAFQITLDGLNLKNEVPSPWNERITGMLSANVTLKNRPATLLGKATVTNAIVERTPLLDRIADYTRIERFRRLIFTRCDANFKRQGPALLIQNIVAESPGLLRLEGELTIGSQDAIQGKFQVGVTPEALRWLPGAATKVFTATRPDDDRLAWTEMVVAGTLQQPTENLSSRLLVAAGESLLVDAPIQAAETALKTASDVLPGSAQQGGSVISQGMDAVTSLIPGVNKAPATLPTEPLPARSTQLAPPTVPIDGLIPKHEKIITAPVAPDAPSPTKQGASIMKNALKYAKLTSPRPF